MSLFRTWINESAAKRDQYWIFRAALYHSLETLTKHGSYSVFTTGELRTSFKGGICKIIIQKVYVRTAQCLPFIPTSVGTAWYPSPLSSLCFCAPVT